MEVVKNTSPVEKRSEAKRSKSLPNKADNEKKKPVKVKKTKSNEKSERKESRLSKSVSQGSQSSSSKASLFTENCKNSIGTSAVRKKHSNGSRPSVEKISPMRIKPQGGKMDEEKEVALVPVEEFIQQYKSQLSNVGEQLEEKMLTLKAIVVQAERDRKIFCIFDSHRFIAQPVRDELLKRGWLEYKPDRATVPRKNRKPDVVPPYVSTPIKVDHTSEAILMGTSCQRECVLHVTPPIAKAQVPITNQNIMEYGLKYEVREPNLRTRKASAIDPRLMPDDVKLVSELMQERNAKITLVWLSSKPSVQLPYFSYIPSIVNKFQKTTFCSKNGLWFNLNRPEIFPERIKFPVQAPRMYNLGDTNNYTDFVLDFYITATASLLRWLVTQIATEGVRSVQNADGKVPLRVFVYAIKKCRMFLTYLNQKGSITKEDILKYDSHWITFLYWFYKVINEGAKIKPTFASQLYLVHCQSVETLRAFRLLRPSMDNDGTLNLWIVKPYSAACGRGIFITNNFSYLEQLNQKRYIIQKYIERPHLIAGTKFDIRQWFLVTSLRPLQVWIYNECYLRFCTVPFDLHNLHESVHLSNNAIQKKYVREVLLPHQNMWDSTTFRKYLKEIGQPDLWKTRIYPGMRDAIASALLCSQFTFDEEPQKGWFEIYGADFMLSYNLREGPWLIEINESPALDPSTPITARLCNQMLRDVIKVVIDYKANPEASTGGWELAFQQDTYPTNTHAHLRNEINKI